jgi:hypothetical protein
MNSCKETIAKKGKTGLHIDSECPVLVLVVGRGERVGESRKIPLPPFNGGLMAGTAESAVYRRSNM